MPNVRVLLFARLGELAGTRETELEVGEGLTVSGAYDLLSQRYPRISELRAHVMYAVNSEYADPSQPLRAGDELALIPPVSGGACAV